MKTMILALAAVLGITAGAAALSPRHMPRRPTCTRPPSPNG